MINGANDLHRSKPILQIWLEDWQF
jgi:hypothetical protein